MQTNRETIRVLYAREHTTVHAGVGVFLAGPTPPDGQMSVGWRKAVIDGLRSDERLCPCMLVVAPEPRTGHWPDAVTSTGQPQTDEAINKQIQWEWQYLEACKVTAFWLPTYWYGDDHGPYPPNIGPTSRYEFGYVMGRWEFSQGRFDVVLGSPDNASGVKWAQHLARSRGVPWYGLATAQRAQLVGESFVEAIAQKLLARKWCACRTTR